MVERTFNTLFMLSSVDGKISTGDTDARDVDKDFPRIPGLSKGLHQYYELELLTDLHSFLSGKVLAKIGMNKKQTVIKKMQVSFIIVDNNHLTKTGIDNLIKKSKRLYLVTTNKNHPAFKAKGRLELIYYPKKIDFPDLFSRLRKEFHVDRVTIQSGGTLNSVLVRHGLIDKVSIVVAPALIGGKDTSTLIDGKSLRSDKDLKQIKALVLTKCEKLKDSYVHLEYNVIT